MNVKQEQGTDGVFFSELQIASAEASDSGAYFCQATNLYGRDQQLVQLTVQGEKTSYKKPIHTDLNIVCERCLLSHSEPPVKPTDLKTVMVNSRSVNIQWSHQTNDVTEVTKYIVQFKEANGAYHKL